MLKKIYSKWPVLMFDILCIPIAWACAFYLRYNLEQLPSPIFSKSSVWVFLILMSAQIIS